MSKNDGAISGTAEGLASEEAVIQRRTQLLCDAKYQKEKLQALETYVERMQLLKRVIRRYVDHPLFEQPRDVESNLSDFANEIWYELRIGEMKLQIVIPKPEAIMPMTKYYFRLSKYQESLDGDTDAADIQLGRVYDPQDDQIMNALSFMEDMQ